MVARGHYHVGSTPLTQRLPHTGSISPSLLEHTSALALLLSILFFLIACDDDDYRVKIKGTPVPHLYAFNEQQLKKYLQKSGAFDIENITDVKRNSEGTALYVYQRYTKNHIIVLSMDGGIETIKQPGRSAYLNDNGEFMTWLDDSGRGMRFHDGTIRYLDQSSTFDVDPSGAYFLIGDRSGPVEICGTDDPAKPLFTSNLAARRIFARDDRIYLFAPGSRNNKKSRKPSMEFVVVCQILEKDGPHFKLAEEIQISRPRPSQRHLSVVDFDAFSGLVLLEEEPPDPPYLRFKGWYLFDLRTGKIANFGPPRGYAFFLNEGLLGKRNALRR